MSESSVSYVGSPSVTGSYQCQGCGAWLNSNVLHLCPTKPNIYATQPIATVLERIAAALEKIADNAKLPTVTFSKLDVTKEVMSVMYDMLVRTARSTGITPKHG